MKPGGTATVVLGVQSMSGATQHVRWTASVPSGSGIEVGPATGIITARSEVKTTQSIEIRVPAGTAINQYLVRFRMRTATGHAALPDVVTEVDVT